MPVLLFYSLVIVLKTLRKPRVGNLKIIYEILRFLKMKGISMQNYACIEVGNG